MSQKNPQIAALNRVMSQSTLVDEMVGYAAAPAFNYTAPVRAYTSESSRAVSTTSAFKSPSYHELLENPHIELDGLQRLQENLAQLEDLHGRLQFMLRDLTGLIRRR
jgi:hypothetical protein